jgi:Domain of unknown function (DUF4402)
MDMLFRRNTFVGAAICWLLLAAAAEPSVAQTAHIAPNTEEVPLRMEIRTQLDFSRATTGGNGSGAISIDPNNGDRRVMGDIIDLGGSALVGSAALTGAPGRAVTVDIPLTIRMTSASGGEIEITNLRTNLPPQPKLDAVGHLEFSFGGDLVIKGSVAGTFRGRIPITAEYE